MYIEFPHDFIIQGFNMEQFNRDNLTESENKLKENTMNLRESNMNLQESKMNLLESEMNIQENDINIQENNINIQENDVNTQENKVIIQENKVKSFRYSEANKSLIRNKISQNFHVFGAISLLFGIIFALLFYNASFGLNVLLFVCVMVALLVISMKFLTIPIKKVTYAYYTGAILLGLSSMLTASEILQFFNIIGIMLLLDLSLLNQFNETNTWDYTKNINKMLLLPFECIALIGKPFLDCIQYSKNIKFFKNREVRNILIGAIISIPLLLFIGSLLSSADMLFGSMTKDIFNFLFSSEIILVVTMVLFGYIACYCIIYGASTKEAFMENQNNRNKADALIGITVLCSLCLVYALFCSIQILYLFNHGLFVLPAEFTFSEYARKGFFELLAVTIINIVLLLVINEHFKESKIIRYLLTFMTICTYIMIASAFYRMLLYIDAYKLSFLRLFVLLFLIIDSFVLAGGIATVWNKRFPLFGFSVVVVTISYLIFSFIKPDYYIAYYNTKDMKEINVNDVIYLTSISFDAAPIVVPYLDKLVNNSYEITFDDEYHYSEVELKNMIENYYIHIDYQYKNQGLRDFNLSYYNANKIVNGTE